MLKETGIVGSGFAWAMKEKEKWTGAGNSRCCEEIPMVDRGLYSKGVRVEGKGREQEPWGMLSGSGISPRPKGFGKGGACKR